MVFNLFKLNTHTLNGRCERSDVLGFFGTERSLAAATKLQRMAVRRIDCVDRERWPREMEAKLIIRHSKSENVSKTFNEFQNLPNNGKVAYSAALSSVSTHGRFHKAPN